MKVLRAIAAVLVLAFRVWAAVLLVVFGFAVTAVGALLLCGAWTAWPFDLPLCETEQASEEPDADRESAGGVDGHAGTDPIVPRAPLSADGIGAAQPSSQAGIKPGLARSLSTTTGRYTVPRWKN